jgi:hypothetical protein
LTRVNRVEREAFMAANLFPALFGICAPVATVGWLLLH